jgi:hypothetical protein
MLSTSIIKSCCRHSRASCHAREPNVLVDCSNLYALEACGLRVGLGLGPRRTGLGLGLMM